MKQRTCKIIFTIFALILLFLSCDHCDFKYSESIESVEKTSQSETILKSSEQVLICVLPEKAYFQIESKEQMSVSSEKNILSIRLVSLIYPVGILAPPSFLF